MINFLRKFRYRQVNAKYIKYALGEIFLVVIGILIALQINDYREYLSEKKLEKNILKEIRQNLIEDMRVHESRLEWSRGIVKSSQIILEHLRQDLPYQDSLSNHFIELNLFIPAPFDVVSTGYERINRAGSEIISNDSVRIAISNYYDLKNNFLETFTDDYLQKIGIEAKGLLLKNLDMYHSERRAIPKDYQALKRDTEFTSTLDMMITVFNTNANLLEDYVQDNLKAQQLVQDEIKRLEK